MSKVTTSKISTGKVTTKVDKKAEAWLLLLLALLTLVTVSVFALITHRNTLRLALAERRLDARRMAYELAHELAGKSLPRRAALQRRVAPAAALAILDGDGDVVVATGAFRGVAPDASIDVGWLGPATEPVNVVAGEARLRLHDQDGAPWDTTLRVEMPAIQLLTAARRLRVLTPVVLGANAALVLVILLYVRTLVTPLDNLLQRARARGRLEEDDDELTGLVRTFDHLADAEERQLAERLAALGELAAGVAHEMRNSLATQRGYLKMAERALEERAAQQDQGEADELAEYLAELRHESDHLKRFVDDFLSFARPGTARVEDVDLERLLRRVAEDPALEGASIHLETAGTGGEPAACHVDGDPQLLERAFRNLLHNAVQAQRRTGVASDPIAGDPIEVRLDTLPAAVEVRIRDRGPGLLAELRDRLFDPFVSERPDGVGLGLALTQRIVTLHRGDVRLDDRADGKSGAEAVVRLPRGS